ncbi:MAG: hypothetical protein ACXAD7_05290 [Candidatus Kariarchaeaceae archaeon]|jgi:hypothetical protein
MSSKLINIEQLKDEITKVIDQYREKLENEAVTKNEFIALIDTLLEERELIIEEVEDLRYNRSYRNYHQDFHMIVNDIDEDAFNSLGVLAQRLNTSTGALLSVLMEQTVELFDDEFPTLSSAMIKPKIRYKDNVISINHVKSMQITDKDLQEILEADTKVSFNHIKELSFENVDFELFKQTVETINHCRIVKFPDSWSKLTLFIKCNFIKYFEFYSDTV